MNYIKCNYCLDSRDNGFFCHCNHCKNTGFVIDKSKIFCNKCNMSMLGSYNLLGLVDCKVSGSMDSFHLTDLTSYAFNLCEKCIRDLFSTFKTLPIVYDNLNGNEEEYSKDLEYFNLKREIE